MQTSALARAIEKDVDLVKGCGVDAVRLSMPISARQRAAKTRVSDTEYVSKALAISTYAKELGLEVVFSPYDTTRCELSLLEELLQAFAREGCVDRVRLVDTTGAATPEAIRFLVRFMDEAGGIPIDVDCHDDFGLATANTLVGVLAGARYISATVNGVGGAVRQRGSRRDRRRARRPLRHRHGGLARWPDGDLASRGGTLGCAAPAAQGGRRTELVRA